MPFQQVRDLRMYFEVHGAGERVLNISGTGGDLRTNPTRGTGLLEKNFEVAMFDQRGLGQTSKPDVAYSMADYADDAAALMDVLGWERAHVVGTSFGGMVAQHFVLRHPTRVNRLVLACTSSGGAGGSSFDLLSVVDLPPSDRARITLPIMDTRNDPTTTPPTHAPGFAELAPFLARPPLNSDDPNSVMGARRQLEARADHDVWDELPTVAVPTLVIGGRFDAQAPPANVQRLAERIPNATLVLCDGGHLFMLQDPTAWATIVGFLQAAGS
jgi:3-oxoadipate enol-lactonase